MDPSVPGCAPASQWTVINEVEKDVSAKVDPEPKLAVPVLQYAFCSGDGLARTTPRPFILFFNPRTILLFATPGGGCISLEWRPTHPLLVSKTCCSFRRTSHMLPPLLDHLASRYACRSLLSGPVRVSGRSTKPHEYDSFTPTKKTRRACKSHSAVHACIQKLPYPHRRVTGGGVHGHTLH
jgi:hypothetical protein